MVVDFPSVNDVADTLFQLTITDENGCEYTQEIEIHPARVFNYNEVLNVCYGDSISLDGSLFAEYDSYSWSVSPNQELFVNGSELDLIVNNSSTITVEVEDLSSSCSFTDELNVQVLNPVIVANDDIGITRGESLTLTITEGEYCVESIHKHGVIVGGWYSLVRILRCGPWSKGGIDEVK